MAAFHFQVSMAATIHHSPRVSLHSVPMGSKGKPKLAFTARSDRLIFVTTPYATFSVQFPGIGISGYHMHNPPVAWVKVQKGHQEVRI